MKKCKVSIYYVETLFNLTWPLGIADASSRDILDIVAINVRTEIAFGLFTDGCTSLYWKTQKRSLLGQNWDVSIQSPGAGSITKT